MTLKLRPYQAQALGRIIEHLRNPETFDTLKERAESMSLPTTQAEWRAVSSAMRTARRAWELDPYSMGAIRIGQGSRYLSLQEHHCGGMVHTYRTPPTVLGYLGLIRHAVHMYRCGYDENRLGDARYLSAVCRSAGPVPLPGVSRK